MTLYTLDEARYLTCCSARRLAKVRASGPRQMANFLFGRGRPSKLSSFERRVVDDHAALIRAFDHSGYGSEVERELEGIASVLGLDGGRCDWEALDAVFPAAPNYAEEEDGSDGPSISALDSRTRDLASFTYFRSVS